LVLLASLASGAIGGIWNYYSVRQPAPIPVVQPLEPKPAIKLKDLLEPPPRDKPEDPWEPAPSFKLVNERGAYSLPKPVQRAVTNAGALVAAGKEQAAKEWLKRYLSELGYVRADDALIMTDWNTFRVASPQDEPVKIQYPRLNNPVSTTIDKDGLV
jgi:hypothetical protein